MAQNQKELALEIALEILAEDGLSEFASALAQALLIDHTGALEVLAEANAILKARAPDDLDSRQEP